MNPLLRLVREAHRRSLWQVLGLYLAGSWAVVEVTDLLTEQVGLPDWTPTMALVLLLIGLPIVMATACVQEGLPGGDRAAVRSDASRASLRPPREVASGAPAAGADRAARPSSAGSDPASAPREADAGAGPGDGTGLRIGGAPVPGAAAVRRVLTWRNAVLGGVGAFALLGFTLVAYVVMWTTGIGPVGNLVAQGAIEEGERVVLALFDDATGEGLGSVVTEALRVDLSSASMLSLVDPADVLPALDRMRVDRGTPLDAELAREVAVREGFEAVLDGDVARAGAGYLITATLREAGGGRAIASFRASAGGPEAVIGAIDKLSQDIRERSGESLRSIRAGAPLDQVTTGSLEALRLYSEADASFVRSDYTRTVALLEEATAIDPAFAMAWRKLAATYNNSGIDPVKEVEAATRAYEHRDRLTPLERHLAEAFYHSQVDGDTERTVAAYRAVLAIDPDQPAALNNLALVYLEVGDLERAAELSRRAVDGPGRSNVAYMNLVRNHVGTGDFAAAAGALAEYEAAYPDDSTLPFFRFWVRFTSGDVDGAVSEVEGRVDDVTLPPVDRVHWADALGRTAYWRGRLDDGRRLMLRAEALAEEASPALAWVRWSWTAYEESLLGDRGWAREHIVRGLDERFDALPPGSRAHAFTALSLALAGERDRAEAVAADHFASLPPEARNRIHDVDVRRASVLARAVAGDTAGVRDEHARLVEESGCVARCFPFERGVLHDALGDAASAARFYEEVRQGGNVFLQRNADEGMFALLRLGPLYEELGETARAVEAYQRVVEQWSGADERGMRVVHAFRARIDALAGGR